MPTSAKIATVADLTDRLQRMEMMVIADYRGLTVSEMADLRKAVRAKGGEVIIAKNTLTRIAAQNVGIADKLEPLLDGPSALAFTYDDIPGFAKAIDDYFKASKKNIQVKGGIVGGNIIQGKDLEQIAKMPTRADSLAKILGGIQAPASRIVGSLNGVMRNIAYILKAHSEKGDAAA